MASHWQAEVVGAGIFHATIQAAGRTCEIFAPKSAMAWRIGHRIETLHIESLDRRSGSSCWDSPRRGILVDPGGRGMATGLFVDVDGFGLKPSVGLD